MPTSHICPCCTVTEDGSSTNSTRSTYVLPKLSMVPATHICSGKWKHRQRQAGHGLKKFRKYLLSLYEQTEKGTGKVAKKQQDNALKKYRRLLKDGYQEEPPSKPNPLGSGRLQNTKGRNLLLRLDEKREAVLAFAWHKCVPFTHKSY